MKLEPAAFARVFGARLFGGDGPSLDLRFAMGGLGRFSTDQSL